MPWRHTDSDALRAAGSKIGPAQAGGATASPPPTRTEVGTRSMANAGDRFLLSGKGGRTSKDHPFKKHGVVASSVFYKLPYAEVLKLRGPDTMHGPSNEAKAVFNELVLDTKNVWSGENGRTRLENERANNDR